MSSIFLAFIQGYNYDQIATILTQKKRSTLRGRQEWNGVMVANIMKNERRWGDLEARKSIVVDYKLGKVTKNNGNRCSAYVPEHHEAIVSPEIARAAHLVASNSKKCGVQDVVVIRQGALKGFVGIRTMLIPKEGCEFIVADFSAIEARVLAWEAGEQWVLDAF